MCNLNKNLKLKNKSEKCKTIKFKRNVRSGTWDTVGNILWKAVVIRRV